MDSQRVVLYAISIPMEEYSPNSIVDILNVYYDCQNDTIDVLNVYYDCQNNIVYVFNKKYD